MSGTASIQDRQLPNPPRLDPRRPDPPPSRLGAAGSRLIVFDLLALVHVTLRLLLGSIELLVLVPRVVNHHVPHRLGGQPRRVVELAVHNDRWGGGGQGCVHRWVCVQVGVCAQVVCRVCVHRSGSLASFDYFRLVRRVAAERRRVRASSPYLGASLNRVPR